MWNPYLQDLRDRVIDAVERDLLCRCGAPVRNLTHSAFFELLDKNAPSKFGTKQLGAAECPQPTEAR